MPDKKGLCAENGTCGRTHGLMEQKVKDLDDWVHDLSEEYKSMRKLLWGLIMSICIAVVGLFGNFIQGQKIISDVESKSPCTTNELRKSMLQLMEKLNEMHDKGSSEG